MATIKTKATIADTPPKLGKGRLKQLVKDAAKSAEAVDLRYVTDSEPGIRRIRKGTSFSYELNGSTVKDEKQLTRIRAMVLPPAWEEVWICKSADGHLQATGIDAKGRKQYRYHPAWNELRRQTKFYHLYEFGKVLPAIKEKTAEHLKETGLTLHKVLATLVSIMQETGIRIGNSAYEKENGSFGLSTLKDKHVKISGGEMTFAFRGKKGVAQQLSLSDKRLARIVKNCRDIPGKELFQYKDEDGNHYPIDSGQLNAYIKEIAGGNFSAKDFRTWTGTLAALQAFREIGCAFNSETEAKRNVNTALDSVSKRLGNTRTVCRKYYVHPAILDLYECSKLDAFLKKLDAEPEKEGDGLTKEEEVLMKILEKA